MVWQTYGLHAGRLSRKRRKSRDRRRQLRQPQTSNWVLKKRKSRKTTEMTKLREFGVQATASPNNRLGNTRTRGIPWSGRFLKISLRNLDGQNRQSPIASVQRTQSTLASHSAAPCGTNGKRMNSNRAIQIALQRTQGLWGLISVFWGEIWLPTNASDSNRNDDSR